MVARQSLATLVKKAAAKAKATQQATKSSASSGGATKKETDSLEQLLETIVSELALEKRHILPMFTHLQDLKKELANELSSNGAALFEKLTTLNSLPETFKIQWLAQQSDMKSDRIVEIYKADKDSLDIMFQFATQMPARLRMPSESQIIEVMNGLLKSRYTSCGSRLATFGAKAVLANNTITLEKLGCYTLQWKGQTLLKARHIGGAVAGVPEGANITDKYVLRDNHDDWGANLHPSPLPDIFLFKFFAADAGPNKIVNYVGKPTTLQECAAELYATWQADSNARSGTSDDTALVTEALRQHKREKSKELMAEARSAAKETLKERAGKRIIKVKAA